MRFSRPLLALAATASVGAVSIPACAQQEEITANVFAVQSFEALCLRTVGDAEQISNIVDNQLSNWFFEAEAPGDGVLIMREPSGTWIGNGPAPVVVATGNDRSCELVFVSQEATDFFETFDSMIAVLTGTPVSALPSASPFQGLESALHKIVPITVSEQQMGVLAISITSDDGSQVFHLILFPQA